MQTLRPLFLSLCLLCPASLAHGQAAPASAERAAFVASAAADRVRFAAPNRVARLWLEVLAPSGDVLFEANSRGSVLDWTLSDAYGNRLADGSYLCVVTVKDLSGRMTQRLTLVEIAGGVASARAATAADLTAKQSEAVGPVEADASAAVAEGGSDAPAAALLAHDGTDGQLVTTSGGLSFRGGDFFTGRDRELMRLSADGSLEVTGALLARGGIRFSDGTVLTSANAPGRAGDGKNAKGGALGSRDPGTLFPSAIANRLPKYDGAGNLIDSAVSEVGGTVGVGTDSPDTIYKLDVRGHIVLGNTRKISFVADFPGNGEIAPGGFFGSLGTSSLTFAPSTDFGLAGPQVKLNYFNGSAWLSALEYANVASGFSTLTLMKNGGNVGVGTTAPQSRLHVAGDVRVAGAGSGIVFADGTKQTTAAAGGGGGVTGTGTAGTVPLWTSPTALGNSVITQSNNNVGIGAPAPTAKLEVVGGAAGGVAASSTGGFALHGSNPTGWAVGADGNTRQSRDRGGWVKAMIYVDQTGAITRCFNSFEPDGGASLAGCGFTVSRPGAGVYLVGFPFAVNDRFYSLAAKAASTTESPRLNTGANFEFDVNPNSLVVSTFLVDAPDNQTADASFMLVVY